MNKKFLSLGALLAGLAVVFGAFGAHALRERLPADFVAAFETGVRYQFYHALALLILGILAEHYSANRLLGWSGNLFIWGISFFSGSLYLLTALRVWNIEGLRWLGILTPIGGLFFIAGWLALFRAVTKK